MRHRSWRDALAEQMPVDWAREVDIFEQQMELRKQDRLSEKIFAETRLRRGVYGQRYDNRLRHDGIKTQQLIFPQSITKGPHTAWDAPGMMRIKVPYGGLSNAQMDVLADLAEEYSDGICHITTRQDIQLHFVHIEDTPDLMRRLAAVGITTREACGNSVRNVTACPFSGVCRGETFDVTPYARALTFFLLGHEDAQDFGRKFKVAFSGCEGEACGLISFHDLGFIARTRVESGVVKRGFAFYVGGGLGPVPTQAKLFDGFLPEDELLSMSQAVCRVFARLGEKNNRARARMKFLVTKLGIEEFKRLVLEERQAMPQDPRWRQFLDEIHHNNAEAPLHAKLDNGVGQGADCAAIEALDASPESTIDKESLSEFTAWRATNVRPQRQDGYVVVTISCPLGDLSSQQMRAVANLARRYTGDTIRTTVEQNLVLRWVWQTDLPTVYAGLKALGLVEPSAGTIVDITSCPGTDTCKLGHASSRGLAAQLREQVAAMNTRLDEAVKELRIKVSGCFNSCGQHHVADLGFYGVGRKVKGYMVPHFQVLLGGEWKNNGGSYGLAIGAVPSKNIPAAVERLLGYYVRHREAGESFQDFIKRTGKVSIKEQLVELQTVPAYETDRSFYSDWGDPREFTTGDLGVGECAGEMVTLTEFGLSDSERQVFEAQTKLDAGDVANAAEIAYRAMLTAAKALLKQDVNDISDDAEDIVREFRIRYYDTGRFFDPFAGGKFAHYLFRQHEEPVEGGVLPDMAHQRIEEAQLFIEAAYACYARGGTAS